MCGTGISEQIDSESASAIDSPIMNDAYVRTNKDPLVSTRGLTIEKGTNHKLGIKPLEVSVK